MPVSDRTWSAVQCPHCSGQMKVGDCTVVVDLPVGVPQPYVRVTEEEEKAARQDWKFNRWAGKMVVLGFAGLVLCSAALAIVMWNSDTTPPHSNKTAEALPDAEKKHAEERWPGGPALAERFLTVRDWRDMRPMVADRTRVEGVMAWYYSRHEFKAVAGPVKLIQCQEAGGEGRAVLQVKAEAPGGRPLSLLLVQEEGSWKVDWEVFVNANTVRWEAFLREPAGAVIELPLLVARKPGAMSYTVKAGGSPDTHESVELWATERKVLAGAVLAKQAAEWRDLEGIGYNDAVKVIARVRLENPALEPPQVKIESIVQRGWVRAR